MAAKKPTSKTDVVGGIGLLVVSYGLTLIAGYGWGSSNGAKDALKKEHRQNAIVACYEKGMTALNDLHGDIVCAHTDNDPLKSTPSVVYGIDMEGQSMHYVFENNVWVLKNN